MLRATPMRSEHASKPLCKADMPKNDSERLDPTVCPYRKLLGCLMFIAMWGRPDIATAVSLCARFQDNPGKRHWQALCHILAYLRQTQHKCIYDIRTTLTRMMTLSLMSTQTLPTLMWMVSSREQGTFSSGVADPLFGVRLFNPWSHNRHARVN